LIDRERLCALSRLHCNALQRTATHCNALQRTATHCNALQRTATHCNALHRAATHGNLCALTRLREGALLAQETYLHKTLATHCNTLQHTATHCNTLQHTATHCNTLQHTATHCNTLQHIDTSVDAFVRRMYIYIYKCIHTYVSKGLFWHKRPIFRLKSCKRDLHFDKTLAKEN